MLPVSHFVDFYQLKWCVLSSLRGLERVANIGVFEWVKPYETGAVGLLRRDLAHPTRCVDDGTMNGQAGTLKRINSTVRREGNQTEPLPTSEGATNAMVRMGYVRIGQHELEDLAAIGVYVRNVGVARICRGKVMVSQQRLNTAIQTLTAAIVELGEKPNKTRSDITSMGQLTLALARLSQELTESQRLLVELERMSPGEDVPEIHVQAFECGKPVRLPITSESSQSSEVECSPRADGSSPGSADLCAEGA